MLVPLNYTWTFLVCISYQYSKHSSRLVLTFYRFTFSVPYDWKTMFKIVISVLFKLFFLVWKIKNVEIDRIICCDVGRKKGEYKCGWEKIMRRELINIINGRIKNKSMSKRIEVRRPARVQRDYRVVVVSFTSGPIKYFSRVSPSSLITIEWNKQRRCHCASQKKNKHRE